MPLRPPDIRGSRLWADVVVILTAVAALVVPLPATQVETWYSRGLYPSIQQVLTRGSNLVPVALLDIAGALALVALSWKIRQAVTSTPVMRALGRAAVRLTSCAAVGYLLFLALWGLNYRRVPLEQKLRFDSGKITQDAVRRLAEQSVTLVNGYHPAAGTVEGSGPGLEAAFGEAQTLLGSTRLAHVGRPKRSLLMLYFRWAAIDGMTDPFFLEIIVNPDVLPMERPFVVAHEWAHLAGYADESEANFVAWLACARSDAAARYSGWLALSVHLLNALPLSERREVAAMLAAGPRRDLASMRARVARSAPVVRKVAGDVYDSYLKANRVERGIESYQAVTRLMLGATFDTRWAPQLRD